MMIVGVGDTIDMTVTMTGGDIEKRWSGRRHVLLGDTAWAGIVL